jgi:hypothetical protein
MRRSGAEFTAYVLAALLAAGLIVHTGAAGKTVPDYRGTVLTDSQLERLFRTPECLKGYRPMQAGPLRRIDAPAGETPKPTYTVERVKVPSDGLSINGWLYLPPGIGKSPLIVLTNGGGNVPSAIKSLSDFMAPVLAHCGIAAFVHDKRGTGESQGVFRETTYDDYIRDAGNAAIFLAWHPRIDRDVIGVMGGSEGGRIAVLAASRYPLVKFAISMAGTVVSMVDDRLYAQLNGFRDRGTSEQTIAEITPFWEQSLAAWASRDPRAHEQVDRDIAEWRKKYPRAILPFTKQEMETRPELERVLSTWRSLPSDYLTELTRFRKKWFALFGAADRVVPTEVSVKNILRYMALSGNKNFAVAVIPRCGHTPVDVETKQRVLFENLTLNWISENVVALSSR